MDVTTGQLLIVCVTLVVIVAVIALGRYRIRRAEIDRDDIHDEREMRERAAKREQERTG